MISTTMQNARHNVPAEYVSQGFTAVKFDPTGGFSVFDPRQPTLESLERTVRLVRLVREAVGDKADLLVGTHGQFTTSGALRLARLLEPYDPLWFEEPVPPDMPEQMALVARGTTIPIAAGRTPHHQVRVCPGPGQRRCKHFADEPWAGRRIAGGKKSRGAGRGASRPDCTASVLRAGGGRGQYSNCRLLPKLSDPREYSANGAASMQKY